MEIMQLQKKLESYLTSLPDYSPHEYRLRMSGAGDCPRLADYLMQDGVGQREYGQAIRMHVGTYLHNMWRDIKQAAFPDDFIGSEEEIRLDIDGYEILGHPDGVWKSMNALDEFKSCADSTFKMVLANGVPIPAHYEQGNTYCGVLGLSQMIFHYFNKDSGESLFLTAPFNPIVFELTKDKFKKRIENKKHGLIEARPYSDPTITPCWYCPKKDACYAGFSSEVQSMTRAKLDPEIETDLYRLVKETSTARTTRLDSERIEKVNKIDISKLLLLRQFSACDIGEFSVMVKLGKNGNSLVEIKERG
jgi:hypothetical protein